MFRRHSGLAMLGTIGLAVGLSGCGAGVSAGDLDAELARVREESRATDDLLSSRIDRLSRRLGDLDAELQAMHSDFDVTVERMQGMLRFNVPVHFAYDEAEVRDLDRPVLDRFASVVGEYFSDAIVTVEGFADPAGNEEYNLQLGQRRAQAVREVLTTSGGLRPDQVKAVSYGEAPNRQVVPGAHGPGPSGIENRRVALVIDYSGVVHGASQ